MDDNNTKSFTFSFSLVQATYWMTACVVLSYSAIYLQSLFFSNFAIGIITALGKVLGALLGPIFAAFLDNHPRIETSKIYFPLLILQMILFGSLQFLGTGNVLTGTIFALNIGLFISENSVILRFCGDCAREGYKLNYGFARGMGSLAFIIPSVFLGIIFNRLPGSWLPVFGIGFTLLQILVNVYIGSFFKGRQSVSMYGVDSESSSLFPFFREESEFTLLLAGIMLLFIGYYSYATFLINVVRNIGGDSATMGAVSGVAAAIEIPFMFSLAKLKEKWDLSKLMVFSVVAFSLKTLATALVTGIPGLFAIQLLQGLGYALYAACIVEYVAKVIPARNLAKGQSLVYTMEMIGGVIASLIAGKLYDLISVKATLLINFGISAVGVVLCIVAIRKYEVLFERGK